MPSDAILKVIVDVQNSEEIKSLNKNLEMQEGIIKRLNTSLQQGAINQQQFEQRAAPVAQRIINTNNALKELQGASGNAGRGLSQLSYAVDDIQYGFNAIVNNIPQIVMGLGGSAGIAGAVGIAAVAINQLIKHWGDLTAAMQAAWEGGSAERLKVLAERAEEAAKAFEKLAKAPTQFEAKGSDIFGKAVADEPAEKFRKAVTDTMIAMGDGAKLRKIPEAPLGIPGETPEMRESRRKATLKQATDEQYKATAKEAAELIGQVQQPGEAGNAARDRLNNMMKRNPGAFSENMKEAFAKSDPALIKKNEEEDKIRKEQEARFKKQEEVDKELAELKAKGDAEEKKDIHDAATRKKQLRIQDLEDKRDAIQKEKHQIAEDLYTKSHERRPGQVLAGGAKAAIDMYQSSAPGFDSPKELAKKAHKLQEDANKRLASIDEQLKKERRVIIPH